MKTKRIGVNELRAIVKEAVLDFKKKSAAEKKEKTEKDKEKSEVKKESTIRVTSEQLQKMIQEAVDGKLEEMSGLVVPRPRPMEPEETSPTPKAGDKVRLASGKMASVADVDAARDMVFITLDGVKMIGLPMDYVSVVDSPSDEPADFASATPPEESEGERQGVLDKYLDRNFLAATTRDKLSKERNRPKN